MKAVVVEEFKGEDALELRDVPDPQPGDGEVLVDVARAGINFADTLVTRDEYLAPQELPLTPGTEVSGTTADGRRVAAFPASGAYAERVVVPEAGLIDIPDAVSDDVAAALLIQGLTAHALLHRCGHLAEGETVVVEAAAGGTGGLAVQLAKRAGARVIGLASSPEKRAHVESLGADATVDSRSDSLADDVRDANGGERVDLVLEMTGGETFDAMLASLAPLGRLVCFGIASQQDNRVSTGHLLQRSRSVIGFWLVHLMARGEEVAAIVGDLFAAVEAGDLSVTIGEVYPLSEVRRAHSDMRDRRTSGKLLLDPSR
ncbi:NADPH:quinone oxidoreductase family protein [Thermoleophilia bacterium SCSIO 60948]|nr:NADPH:quinone oxidoreductase family protein [Thermoleophilia bacterium SCSIO 60948]